MTFVVASELTVDPIGAAALQAAFRDRLHEVEAHPGFQHLEVWRDLHREGAFSMITWWDDEESFRSYMRSEAHHRSHARIPSAPARARGTGLRRFESVAR